MLNEIESLCPLNLSHIVGRLQKDKLKVLKPTPFSGSYGFLTIWPIPRAQVPNCTVPWMLFSKESTLRQARRLVLGLSGLGLFDSLIENDPNVPWA
jgi:hypothetical protein